MLFYPTFKSNVPDPHVIVGRFQPNGTSAITQPGTNKGPNGWTVAYSATGIYTITLNRKYYQCLYAEAHPSFAVAADADVQVGAIDVAVAKTVVLRGVKTSDGTTAVAFANDADTWIHFMLVLTGTQGK